MSKIILKTENLVKEFYQGGSLLRAVKGISMEIYSGEILALVGPSGAGKSTLLHMMGFLDRPTSGEVIFNKTRLSGLSESIQGTIRNKYFGFVFQMYHLLPELNILENILTPAMISKGTFDWIFNSTDIKNQAMILIDRLGLINRINHRPNQLSGGEQQRVAIARSLIMSPSIVYCDEPAGNLDKVTALEILNLIVELNKETNKTFVIVTHDERVTSLASRIMHLEDGMLKL